ncbi:YceI family protein [Falsochrobactrum sp. TDYN1]|uniref:YceI family protein n=1 Tax=Falsochrobactrum tianjinense TaxID=2706015 RepID=A0A949PNW8_9HYPH|nr:YceI family protein [Falsochrobactrum sp. TDYN1]MBV2143514.1 YceI family protein [Falsochrobactrum sp. TDYN1]
MKRLVLAALAGLALSTSALAADTYVIDTEGAHASINFTAPHLGFSYIVGRFNTFEGQFIIDEANPANSSIEVKVNTKSIDTNMAARDNHLRAGDFLNADKFPEATFKSTSITVNGDKEATVAGDFTIRGVTFPVKIDAEMVGSGTDPWGKERMGFQGETSIKLSDFGVTGDFADLEVNLDLHVEGVKQ